MIKPTIKGVQEVQAAAVRSLGALRPEGALGKAVQFVTAAAHRHLTGITPYQTGAWRGSHIPDIKGLHGRIYINPEATNPKSQSRPVDYGTELELERKGKYAVYATTAQQAGPRILGEAGRDLGEVIL